jgi:hypothetical protein
VSSLPPRSILVGVGRWIDLLQRVDRARAWDQLRTGRFQDLTPTQYAAAFDWLVESQLVDTSGRPCANGYSSLVEQALATALDEARPAWLSDEQALSDASDLPSDLAEAADALELSMDSARRVAQARAGKVNAERRALIGALGERLLVELLRRSTTLEVFHVSLESDHWGFDIRVCDGRQDRLIEVKTTAAGPRADFFVSRHEVAVASQEPGWSLVLVTLKSEDEIGSLAVVDRSWIVRSQPMDRFPWSRWESARMRPTASAVSLGLSTFDLTLVPGAAPEDASLLRLASSTNRRDA